MSENTPEQTTTGEADPAEQKLVPVGESIKYRRRAQQAEGRLQELQQKLEELEAQLSSSRDEIATAEAQRDEAGARAMELENRLAMERKLSQAGVVDIETASVLLSKRLDLSEPLDDGQLDRQVEQLLTDKPFLATSGVADLPGKTASPRPSERSGSGELAAAARRAVGSGDRRDIAEYLRLRRMAAAAAE
ncbi:MAG: hypothetical protein ACP5HU_10960 [Phycisphaerae bacterium]